MPNRPERSPFLLLALIGGLMLLAMLVQPMTVHAQDEPPPEETPAAAESFPAYLPFVMQATGIVNTWPPTGATGTSANVNLEWSFANALIGQPRFTLYFEAGDSTPDVAVVTDQAYAGYDPPTL
ncbi:MAG: hypothetical protein KDE45_04620, partial [Caldilineaceae bacterium]|nr:hypothetical protein [Caldilineaceae bacterium]